MRLRLFMAIVCVFLLVAELSFDSTNSFVRISPETTPFILSSSDSTEQKDLFLHDGRDFSGDRKQDLSDSTFGYSLGHFARPATAFSHIVHEVAHSHAVEEFTHYLNIVHFVLLRPPIALT